MDWFLNNRDLRHEWVKENLTFRSQEAYFGLCEKFMLWLLLLCENIFGLLEKLILSFDRIKSDAQIWQKYFNTELTMKAFVNVFV